MSLGIGRKLINVSLFSLILLFILVLTGWLGYRTMDASSREAEAFERQSMWLQTLFRGVNETILTEGTPYSISIIQDAIRGLDENNKQILSGADEKTRLDMERRIEGSWHSIRSGLGPFLRENAVSQNDLELMIEYGSLLAEGDRLMEEMQALSAEARVRTGKTIVHAKMVVGFLLLLIIVSIAWLHADLYRSIAIPVRKLRALMTEISRKEKSSATFMNESELLLSERLDRKEKKLAARITDIRDLTNSFDAMIKALNDRAAEGQRIQDQLEKLATLDELTQSYNRTKFEDLIGREMDRASRYNHPLSIIMFDLDHFKKVNDRFGHLTGDQVLKTVADIVRSNIRDSDFLVRWGGEEFLVLAPETNRENACMLAERLRRALSEHIFDQIGGMTASFGVAEYIDGETKDSFVLKADNAMYRAKNSKNRVEQSI